MSTIHDTTVVPDLLVVLAQHAVLAKRAKQDADATYKAAVAQIIDGFLAAGITTVTLPDGTKVTLKGGLEGEQQRSFDADALASIVPATVLDKVTDRTVNTKRFDAAVACGLIAESDAERVTEVTDKARSITITSPIKR